MKRLTALLLIVALCAFGALAAAKAIEKARRNAFEAGWREGMEHAIKDSTIYTPERPHENARDDGTDQTIYIEIDGEVHERGMYQG